MTQMLLLSSVAVFILAGCQTDAEGIRGARGVGPDDALARELALVVPACLENLPKARTLVLQGADCAQRTLRHCVSGHAPAPLDAEFRTLAERCGLLRQSQLLVGATFEDGCAEEIRLSAEVPSDGLRCLADALNEIRLDCAESSSCALVGLSTLATK